MSEDGAMQITNSTKVVIAKSSTTETAALSNLPSQFESRFHTGEAVVQMLARKA